MDFPVNDLAKIGTTVYDRYSMWRNLKLDTESRLRLLRLECLGNLELISSVNLDPKNKNISSSDEDYLYLMSELETEIIEMVFLSEDESKHFFKSIKNIKSLEEIDEASGHKKKAVDKSAIELIEWLYLKISVIKKLAILPNSGLAHKKIKYRYRLSNINKHLEVLNEAIGRNSKLLKKK